MTRETRFTVAKCTTTITITINCCISDCYGRGVTDATKYMTSTIIETWCFETIKRLLLYKIKNRKLFV